MQQNVAARNTEITIWVFKNGFLRNWRVHFLLINFVTIMDLSISLIKLPKPSKNFFIYSCKSVLQNKERKQWKQDSAPSKIKNKYLATKNTN